LPQKLASDLTLKLGRGFSETPDRLAAELASAAHGLTGADIAYLCQRAAMFCVKDAVEANDANEISIARHHFDAAVSLLTTDPATNATHASQRLLLAG
jgi:SpoVK/Ycf46/Vps4 family AAA+-type ATPase